MQATPAGKRVELTFSDQNRQTVCRVRDEGRGIPDAMRTRLFNPVVSGKEGGSGLGLAISRQLALHLGGRLELVETGAGGSVFELSIPVAPEAPADTDRAKSVAAGYSGKRISGIRA
jgi:signal transduction histidine kinase